MRTDASPPHPLCAVKLGFMRVPVSITETILSLVKKRQEVLVVAQSDGRLAARCAALSGPEDFTCPGPKGKHKLGLTVGPWQHVARRSEGWPMCGDER